MSMQDPIADFITIINNASRAFHPGLTTNHSNIRENLCRLLQEQGYIQGFEVEGEPGRKRTLTVALKYHEGKPVIRDFRRVSKVSLRRYVGKDELPVVFNGFGEAVISTPQGLMTARQAKEKQIGGELICTIF